MTIDLTLLDPTFMGKCQALLNGCASQNVIMVPTYGLRTLEAQAKLWRQSRSTAVVTAEIQSLRAIQCDYLADILQGVGPQPTAKWATDAIPGLSWHNWGQALDCMWQLDDGSFEEDGDTPGYHTYGQQAKSLGLRWGGDFSHEDYGHVQLNQKELTSLYPLKYINDHFKDKDVS